MAQTKWNQLGIALGNKCNMMCDHCLPSSSIKEEGGLSSAEQEQIANYINEHRIPELSFTGGEPMLFYTETIFNILSRLEFRPKVRITTNASFVKLDGNWKTLLSNLSPDHLRISYDRHHSKFLGLNYIEELVSECEHQGIEHSIEACISSPMELVEISSLPKWFRRLLRVNKTLRAGRAKKTGCYFKPPIFEEAGLGVKCPFVAKKDLMFWPGRGFTFCCNNLAVANEVSAKTIFFQTPEEMESSPAWVELNSVRAMSDLLRKKPELALDPVNSEACNLCESYFTLPGKEA